MEAAAHGHSTLGIPPKVGRDFVQADSAREERGERGPDRDDKRRKPKRTGISDVMRKAGY